MVPKKKEEKDLIGFDEAAKLIQVSRTTIQRLVNAGKLTTYKRLVEPGHGRGNRPRMLDRAEVEGLQGITRAEVRKIETEEK